MSAGAVDREFMYVYIYINIYIERERENLPSSSRGPPGPPKAPTETPRVGPDLHSLPEPPELSHDVFLTFS